MAAYLTVTTVRWTRESWRYMQRPHSWRDLTPGLIVSVLLIVAAIGILRFARVGALHGDTMALVVLAGDAGELANGSEVWIAGQKVGLVEKIDFREPGSDTAYRLRLELSVLAHARPLLRTDSRARIAPGGSLLGASVLALSVGSATAPSLSDGDTILAVGRAVVSTFTEGLEEVREPLTALRENVVAMTSEFGTHDGTLGAILNGDASTQAVRLAGAIDAMYSNASSKRGTVALAMNDAALRKRLVATSARADSLRQLLASNAGSLGRFRRDSTLVRQIAEVRDEVSILKTLVSSTDGTIGRARTDSAITVGLSALEAELARLVDDIKRRPLRYLIF